MHGTFSKIDHIIGHKTGLSRYKKIIISLCIPTDHYRLKLVFNNKKNNRKLMYTGKVNSSLLNDSMVKGEIKKKIKEILQAPLCSNQPYL